MLPKRREKSTKISFYIQTKAQRYGTSYVSCYYGYDKNHTL